MGPRPIGRGNGSNWSNVSEIPPLQWGRDQLVAEIVHDVVDHQLDMRASMGPRPIGRGNPEGGRRGQFAWSASMGPRPIGRGNE